MHVLISGLSILSHGSMCLSFGPIPYYLDYSRFVVYFEIREGFPGGSDGEESACNAGDQGSIPWSGMSLGGGHGNPLQYSCLENPTGRGAWWAGVHGVAEESDTTERLTLRHTRYLVL